MSLASSLGLDLDNFIDTVDFGATDLAAQYLVSQSVQATDPDNGGVSVDPASVDAVNQSLNYSGALPAAATSVVAGTTSDVASIAAGATAGLGKGLVQGLNNGINPSGSGGFFSQIGLLSFVVIGGVALYYLKPWRWI